MLSTGQESKSWTGEQIIEVETNYIIQQSTFKIVSENI